MSKRGNPNMKKGKPTINPTGRGGLQARVDAGALMHKDGWQNMLTGVGVAKYDKRLAGVPVVTEVNYQTAQAIWRGDDIGGRAVEIPAEDMIRQGFDFIADAKDDESIDTLEVQEQVEKAWTDLGIWPIFKEALMKRDAYGGCAVLIGAKDSQADLTQPLNEKAVREISFLNVFDTSEIEPEYYYGDPVKANYGKPAIYRMSPNGTGQTKDVVSHAEVHIHESRLLIFNGRMTTNQITGRNGGWGDSIYVQMIDVLRDFNASWDGTGTLVQEFGQATIKLKGLNALLCSVDGERDLKIRLQAMQLCKSTLRANVLDSEDEWLRSSDSLAGLAEILRQYMGRMSSAARGLPITKLFGVAPAGLNSSGDSDIAQWDDRIKSMQVDGVLPNLEKLTRIILSSLNIKCKEWSIVPRPLRQATEKETAETRYIVAQTDEIYANMSALSADEIAKSRWGGDVFSMETVVDFDDRLALEAEIESEAQLAIAAAAAAVTPNPNQAPEPDDKSAEPGADKAKEQSV